MESASIREQAAKLYWYHCVDLGQGIVTDGDYEIGPILPSYHFPSSMADMQVLDVGRGSGAFSFELERGGAAVTATDLLSFFDWDFVGGDEVRVSRTRSESIF